VLFLQASPSFRSESVYLTRDMADMDTTGGTAIAGAGAAVAAAAYIDARFHLTKDISDMLLLRKWTKHFGNQSTFSDNHRSWQLLTKNSKQGSLITLVRLRRPSQTHACK